MVIGIVVYSHTGHTLSVAAKLKQRLSAAGHRVQLAQLETVEPLKMGDTTAQLKTKPAIEVFDGLVFACPVRGGMPAPPMRVYLEQVASLEAKSVACLVTGFLPAPWGRSQTLAWMEAVCKANGALCCGSGSVWWPIPGRRRHIVEVVNRLTEAFSEEIAL